LQEKRWVSIASSIKGAIRRGELHAGARIASETEMATQWNVSPMTVHRALTELQREGWVVRRRKIGTVVADRSAMPATKVALIFTNHADLPQGAYAAGIEENLGEGLQLVPLSTHGSAVEEAKCLERAVAECSAIICYPTGAPENTALMKKAAAAKPLLLIDCMPEGIEADVVMTDNFGSMLMGLQHLRALGHARIAYFMEFPHLVSSVRERFAGYQQFMKQEIGVDDPERWVRRFSCSMSWEQYCGRVETVLAELLSEDQPITAIACQQDAVMAALLEACVQLGVSVPEDLAILSFNDMPPRMQPLAHSVHRLVQRPIEMGAMVAKRIQQRLNSPQIAPQQMRLMTDLYPAVAHITSDTARQFRAARLARRKTD
jgi:GntR family transcriptional regulator of arabinose operon